MNKKLISILVLSAFLLNDLCYGLSPAPGTNVPDTRDAMYALGQKLFARNYGPGAIDFNSYEKPDKFQGTGPDIQDIEFTKSDYNNLPAGWEKNPLLQETDLIEAFRSFRTDEANIPDEDLEIIEGYFPVSESQLGIARIEPLVSGKFRMVIHPDFVSMWNHIRENDVCFEYKDPSGEARTVSAAWGIFYRVAKHEMTDLAKAGMKAKSFGHLAYSPERKTELILDGTKETEANRIAGRYAGVNDAVWMWFLASYAFRNTTRYDNDLLEKRIKWFFSEENKKTLAKEFPSVYESLDAGDISTLEDKVKIALAVNYHFFGDLKDMPQFDISPDMIDAYNERMSDIRFGKDPVYATGLNNEAVSISKNEEKSRILRISDDPALKEIWEDSVYHNLRLFQFAAEFTRISAKIYKDKLEVKDFPLEDIGRLMSLVDFKDTEMLSYNLSFILSYDTYSRYRSLLGEDLYHSFARAAIERGRLLLLFLISAERAGVNLKDIFIEPNSNYVTGFLRENGLAGKLSFLDKELERSMFMSNINFFRESVFLPEGKADEFRGEMEKVYAGAYQGARISWQEAARSRYGSAARTNIRIISSYEEQFDAEFFERPLEYIRERQERDDLLLADDRISSVLGGADIIDLPVEAKGKITKFRMRNGKYAYLKRVNPLRVRYPEEEIDIAGKAQEVFQRTDPRYHAQKFIGIVYEKGVFYLLSVPLEKDDVKEPDPNQGITREEMAKIMRNNGIILPHDIEEHLLRLDDGTFYRYLLDFETFPYSSVNYRSISGFMRKKYRGEDAPSAAKPIGREEGIVQIIGFFIDLALERGPGAGRELTDRQRTNIWQAVNLMHKTNIEIYIPRSIKPTKAMQKTLIEINRKMNKKGLFISLVRYRTETLLSEIGKSREKTESGIKRIVLTSGKEAGAIFETAEFDNNIGLFRDVRVLNISVPELMSEDRMTVIQARIVMIAILARLLDGNSNPEVKQILTGILENSFEGFVDINEFISRLGEKEDARTSPESIRKRLAYFLSGVRAISLIKKLELELRALREFWTYA